MSRMGDSTFPDVLAGYKVEIMYVYLPLGEVPVSSS